MRQPNEVHVSLDLIRHLIVDKAEGQGDPWVVHPGVPGDATMIGARIDALADVLVLSFACDVPEPVITRKPAPIPSIS